MIFIGHLCITTTKYTRQLTDRQKAYLAYSGNSNTRHQLSSDEGCGWQWKNQLWEKLSTLHMMQSVETRKL